MGEDVERTAEAGAGTEGAVEVSDLHFVYTGSDGHPIPGCKPLFKGLDWSVDKGSRILLIGANGAGKTSLLKIIAGKHMVPATSLSVLGVPPFQTTDLTTSGRLAYIGGTWKRDVAFAGYNVPLQGDISAGKMIEGIRGVPPARREKLLKVLDINPAWRMHLVSEGQRRRVQLCVGLLKEFDVLLLDEVTVDLDVLVRADLMRYLKEESEERHCTIIYATHIFDGLEKWPSHLAFLAKGELDMCRPAAEYPELQQGKLVDLVARWLRSHQEKHGSDVSKKPFEYSMNNGWSSGRSNASIKLSSNAVLRM